MYLIQGSYEKAIEYRTEHKSGAADFDNVTRLEKIKEIWENVISHRKIKNKRWENRGFKLFRKWLL